jgi:cytochrome c oxidase subunit 1
MPRRIVDYAASTGWGTLNLLSTLGAFLLGLGTIPFLAAVVLALREPATAGDDPWGGNSLEWATSSPPPHHNFRRLPPIRSERPVFDERLARAGIDPPAVGVEPDGGPPGADAAEVAG